MNEAAELSPELKETWIWDLCGSGLVFVIQRRDLYLLENAEQAEAGEGVI